MKKFRGTKYAHIATTARPILNAQFDEIEQELSASISKLDEMIASIRELLDHEG